MSATTFSTVRETILSVAGALLFSTMLGGAAVVPAQTATAAVLGL